MEQGYIQGEGSGVERKEEEKLGGKKSIHNNIEDKRSEGETKGEEGEEGVKLQMRDEVGERR